jgi:hypothetical protein
MHHASDMSSPLSCRSVVVIIILKISSIRINLNTSTTAA